jgi:hypothetical protein
MNGVFTQSGEARYPFSATCEEKISRLGLEMTVSSCWESTLASEARQIEDFSFGADDTAMVAEVITDDSDVGEIQLERANYSCSLAIYQAPYITSRICFDVSGVSMPLAWSSARQIRLQKAMTA